MTEPIKYMTTEEVAERLRQSDQTVRNICHRGELPYMRSGRKILIPEEEFNAYLARNTRQMEASS